MEEDNSGLNDINSVEFTFNQLKYISQQSSSSFKSMPKKLEKILKKEIPLPPHKYTPPCVKDLPSEKTIIEKSPTYYNCLPRDCKFTYMTPGYYATGFRILDVYRAEIDFSEIRRLLFLEDSKTNQKWGNLRPRIPYAAGRVMDLPGTRDLNYENYCLRSLTPESAGSWRKSIKNASSSTKIVLSSE